MGMFGDQVGFYASLSFLFYTFVRKTL